jgi:hypothetical protein
MTTRHFERDKLDQRPALVSRQADFWLLGGASIVFWVACHLLEFLQADSPMSLMYLQQIPALFAFTALLINAPHFMASYHLAYSRGKGFIVYYWPQLILVPLILLALLLVGDLMFARDIDGWRSTALQINYWLEPFGIFLVLGTYSSLGPELLHHLVNLMYLTVGWHYTKQVFGCFMVYSRFENYPLTPSERNLIKSSLLAIWGFNFFSLNAAMTQSDFLSAGSTTHVFPSSLVWLFQYGTVVLFVAVAYQVFYRRWKTTGQLPPAPAVIAWLAMFLWWMPFGRSMTFYAFAVPFFHGLQYLPFYKKVIDARHRDPTTAARSFSFHFALLIAAGFIAFALAPEAIDHMRNSEQRFAVTYWVAGVALFINIHHFFIDNTIWRLRDENVRRWLLS